MKMYYISTNTSDLLEVCIYLIEEDKIMINDENCKMRNTDIKEVYNYIGTDPLMFSTMTCSISDLKETLEEAKRVCIDGIFTFNNY